MMPPTTTPSVGEARRHIAMDIVALWGLCAYGSRRNLAANDL